MKGHPLRIPTSSVTRCRHVGFATCGSSARRCRACTRSTSAAVTAWRSPAPWPRRSSGRRWLEQYSNVQNATHAFEQLLSVQSQDREARDTLSELYKKRRAWSELFQLYDSELPSLDGPRRIAVMKEMAQLAAERLGKGEVASKLYLEILEAEPGNSSVLDALEKQAERARDWQLLANALERRLKSATAPAEQVARDALGVDLQQPEWKGRWGAPPARPDFQAIVSALLELKARSQTSAARRETR